MSKSPSLRRIQADIRELALDPSDRYHASPMENDMFEWHFTIRGADGTDFEGGIYHGRILLPPDYPYKPPHIVFLNASGRFETNTKVCLSFSAYHPELWQPAWGVRLILEALISFLPTPADGAIGALDWSATERKKLAAKSVNWECACCGRIANLLPKLKKGSEQKDKPNRFQKEIEQLQLLQQQEHKKEVEILEGVENELVATDDGGETTDTNQDSPLNESAARIQEESDRQQQSEEAPLPSDSNVKNPDEAAATTKHVKFEQTPPVSPAPLPRTPAAARVTPPAEASPAAEAATTAEATAAAVEQRAVVTDDHNTETQPPPPLPVAATHDQPQETWLWDPLLQAIIVVLSMICYLLLRKVQGVWDDLRAID